MSNVDSINPATEEIFGTAEASSNDQIDLAVHNARTTYAWRDMDAKERAERIAPLVQKLEKDKDALAKVMAGEVGKPVKAGRHEVDLAKARIDAFCQQIPDFVNHEVMHEDDIERNTIYYEPKGIAVVISPWNSPVFVALAGIIPPLLTGNAVIWKPSEYATQTGILIAEAIASLNIPEYSFQCVIGGKEVGKRLVKADVDVVALTGSTRAGIEVLKDNAEHIRPAVLELGGKDPAIICSDADIEVAAKTLVKSATLYTGQLCFSVERVYCMPDIYEEFITACTEEMKKLKVGDPYDESTDTGPLSVKFQFEHVLEHLKDAKEKGAKVLLGGERQGDVGYFIKPTILTNVTHAMKVMRDETFGPLLPIMSVENEDEAVKHANDTAFGLTASIWTRDTDSGEKLAKRLQAGTVEINRHGMSRAGMPWGGYKKSGMGRIYSKEGIRELTNVKHVWTVK